MKLTCAAAALCGMKGTPLDNPVHFCMYCKGPLHGAAFCGKLYCEEIVPDKSYDNLENDLKDNDHAKALATSATAIMCLQCVRHKLTRRVVAPATAPTAPAAAAAASAAAAAAAPAPPNIAAAPTVSAAALTLTAPAAKKKRNEALYDQFDRRTLPDGRVSIKCKHCDEFNRTWKNFNATKAKKHLDVDCEGSICPITKRKIHLGSHSGKKRGNTLALISNPAQSVAEMRRHYGPSTIDLCSDSEDVSDITPSSTLSHPTKKKKRTPSNQTTLEQTYGGTMNQKATDAILMNEVRAIVARGEQLSRLLDPWVQASLVQRYPAISKFLPTNTETIFDKYVVKIDKDTMSEMKTFMAKIPGHVNVAMNGVSVLGKQKVSHPFLFNVNISFQLTHITLPSFLHYCLDCLHCCKE